MVNIKQGKQILIPNNFLLKNKYSNKTIYVYALIQKMFNYRGYTTFTLYWLFNELGIKNIDVQDEIRECLQKLQVDKIVRFNCNIICVDKNEMLFGKITIFKRNFVLIYDNEFDVIHNYNSKEDKYKLFSLFSSIKARMMDTKGYCYPSFDTIKENTGINSNTSVSKYLKILQDKLNLIMYENPGEFLTQENGKWMQKPSNNIYVITARDNYKEYGGRYQVPADTILKDAVESRIKKSEENKIKIKDHNEANIKRSESMVEYWKEVKGEKEDLEIDDPFEGCEGVVFDE